MAVTSTSAQLVKSAARADWLLGISAGLLALFVYDGVLRPLVAGLLALPALPGGINTLTAILTLFSLVHATYTLGLRHSLAFFGLSAVISYLYEQVGVGTGLVFGPYHYTDLLGTKLGDVPFLIPLAWFMMIYPSYVIANLIADGRATGTPQGWSRLVWLAALSAVVMTAWDVVVDPVLSGPTFRAWVWERGGEYFGVPVHNYVGWLLTTFSVYIVYRRLEQRALSRPMGARSASLALLPLAAYGAMLLSNLLSGGGPPALLVIAPFVMGVPIVAAASRLFRGSGSGARD